jgi:hypothetical protein
LSAENWNEILLWAMSIDRQLGPLNTGQADKKLWKPTVALKALRTGAR